MPYSIDVVDWLIRIGKLTS